VQRPEVEAEYVADRGRGDRHREVQRPTGNAELVRVPVSWRTPLTTEVLRLLRVPENGDPLRTPVTGTVVAAGRAAADGALAGAALAISAAGTSPTAPASNTVMVELIKRLDACIPDSFVG